MVKTVLAGGHAPLEGGLPLLRLMHLVSPSLPIGAFTYSAGIEWAVEAGWIRSAEDLEQWLLDQLHNGLAPLDLPIAMRMHRAAECTDLDATARWIDWLLAARETAELRQEEVNRGRALAGLLLAWGLPNADRWRLQLARSQTAGFAFAAANWGISAEAMAAGLAWGWLENLTLAATKIIPLGQTDGQRLLHRLLLCIPEAVRQAAELDDRDIGASSPALAIASSAHEQQYTRLFRS